MTPKRAVHVTSVHDLSTDTRILRRECESLLAAGIDVHVVATEPSAPVTSAVPITWVHRPRSRRERMTTTQRAVYRALMALRPDVVHVHDPELIPMGLYARRHGCKFVYDVHEDMRMLVRTKEWIAPALRRPFARGVGVVEDLVARGANLIVSATEPIAARFPSDRTIVVRNFPRVDIDLSASDDTATAVRDGGAVYVGSVTEERGALVMAAASALVHGATGTGIRFVGPCVPDAITHDLKRYSKGTAIVSGRVPAADVPALLARAQVGLVTLSPVPHHIEALPTKLFEYMAAGLPVVASDFPEWRAIVEGAGAGLVVDPEDPRAVADAVIALLDDADRARALGAAGAASVRATYRWEVEAERLVDAYGRL